MTVDLAQAPPAELISDAVRSTRLRHPGDVIRLVLAGTILVVTLVVVAIWSDRLLGPDAAILDAAGPDSTSGQALLGLTQVVMTVATAVAAGWLLYRRRFRLLATTASAALVGAALYVVLRDTFGGDTPAELSRALAHDSWLASTHFPSPAWIAGAVAVAVAIGPWLTRPWRRAAFTTLVVIAGIRLATGTVLPMELVLAVSVGFVIASAILVAFGAPDRSPGPADVARALASGGLPLAWVRAVDLGAKGSVTFIAADESQRGLFVKVLGRDQRDADLLYRAYRFARLRGVDDVRPARSLQDAVEHQALVGMVAQRAGVNVPQVDRVVPARDGSALLVMERVDGATLADLAPEQIDDTLLAHLWEEVDRLHRAGIAHRSLRTANVMVDTSGRPFIIDFSFAELSATDRQLAIDRAELLASLSVIVGPERAAAVASNVIGRVRLGPAVRYLQPLALSAATRHELRAGDKALDRARNAAALATDVPADDLARVERVRPRTLLMIAVLAGAFYFLLPQLAQADNAWKAFQSADFAWIPLVIALSFVTYIGAAFSLTGAVPMHVRFVPTFLTQIASSFVNRVTPASIGGMVVNERFLEKAGADRGAAIAAVGANTLAGGIVHVVLMVGFFVWSGSELGKAFKLPSTSKLLLVVPIVLAALGAVLATRWGRHRVIRPLLDGVRSAALSLREVARSPIKLVMLFGGSVIVTAAYIVGLWLSVRAFHGDVGFAKVGAVYLGARAVASAAPTPGNLGAIEAALVAGLTGVGASGGVAVSSVLTFRVATYWLPIIPGWICWWWIQRREYV
jgi:uncharacterized membrane protein YbhN (UPF0104 family)